MPLPLVLWIYFAFGLILFFAVIAFLAYLFAELEKQNLREQQDMADEEFYRANQNKK